MAVDTETTSQVNETVTTPTPETEKPQVSETTVSPQPGEQLTVTPPVTPPKTYTEEEIRKRESDILKVKDSEIAQAHQRLAQTAIAQQIQQMQAEEANALAKDQKDVNAGLLSQEEAAGRSRSRQQYREQEWRNQQLQREAAALNQKTEEIAYIQVAWVMANNIGTEEGLTQAEINELSKDLLSGEHAPNPHAMEAKALRIINKKHREALKRLTAKPESFDKGPGQSTGKMSDSAFLKAYAAGDSDDHKRASRLLEI